MRTIEIVLLVALVFVLFTCLRDPMICKPDPNFERCIDRCIQEDSQ